MKGQKHLKTSIKMVAAQKTRSHTQSERGEPECERVAWDSVIQLPFYATSRSHFHQFLRISLCPASIFEYTRSHSRLLPHTTMDTIYDTSCHCVCDSKLTKNSEFQYHANIERNFEFECFVPFIPAFVYRKVSEGALLQLLLIAFHNRFTQICSLSLLATPMSPYVCRLTA